MIIPCKNYLLIIFPQFQTIVSGSAHYKRKIFYLRSREAFGRVQRLNLRLLEYDDWIYVPQCQDPTPMTEDMLAEQAEVFAISYFFLSLIRGELHFFIVWPKHHQWNTCRTMMDRIYSSRSFTNRLCYSWGMDAEGAELRAKMQSASLLSDMESFKAANPGAILADFVRWHSPRDWEESADGKSKVIRIIENWSKLTELWKSKPKPFVCSIFRCTIFHFIFCCILHHYVP